MFTKRKYWALFWLEVLVINLAVAVLVDKTVAQVVICPLIVMVAGMKLICSLEHLKMKTALEEAKENYGSSQERESRTRSELVRLKDDLMRLDEGYVPDGLWSDVIAAQKKALIRSDEIIVMLRTLNEAAEQRLLINKAQIRGQKDLIDRLKGKA